MHLVEKLVLSPWFWLDVVLSVTGGLLVWWGLQIEKKAEKLIPPSDFKPDIFGDILEQQKWELERGWRILMRGIALEVVAALGISIISGLEIADLTDKAASAIERTALVESNNLVLRSNVVALEIKLQPRTITPKQIENFIFLTEKIDKIPINICVGQADQETETYAYQIRCMFNQAGFKLDSSASLFGITRNPEFRMVTPIAASKDPTVYFVTSNPNFVGTVVYPLERELIMTNGIKRTISRPNNTEDVYEGLQESLHQIKIDTRYFLDTNSSLVKPGEFAFFVSEK